MCSVICGKAVPNFGMEIRERVCHFWQNIFNQEMSFVVVFYSEFFNGITATKLNQLSQVTSGNLTWPQWGVDWWHCMMCYFDSILKIEFSKPGNGSQAIIIRYIYILILILMFEPSTCYWTPNVKLRLRPDSVSVSNGRI